MADPSVEDDVGEEQAHASWISSSGGSVEAPLLVPANHLLLVSELARVATIVGQRACVKAGCVEGWPTYVPETFNAVEVGVNSRGLGAVAIWKLALVARNGGKDGVAMGRAQVVKDPDAGHLAIHEQRVLLKVPCGDTTQVFGVFEEAADEEASEAGSCNSADDADREMNKLVAIIGTSLLVREHAGQAPRVGPSATGLRALLVRPVRSTPGPAGGTKNAHVVFTRFHCAKKLILVACVEKVVGSAANQDVDLDKLEAKA